MLSDWWITKDKAIERIPISSDEMLHAAVCQLVSV